MANVTSELRRPGQRVIETVCCVFFATPLIALILPKSLAIILPGLAVLALAHMIYTGPVPQALLRFTPLVLAAGAFFLLAAISALWASDPGSALSRGLLGILAVGSAHVIYRWIGANVGLAVRASKWFLVGAAGGLAFLVFEVTTHQAISTLLVVDILGQKLGFYHLNLNLSVAMLLLWPCLILLRRHLSGSAYNKACAGILAILAYTVLVSEHGTSKLAFSTALLTLFAARLWPRLAKLALQTIWLTAILFMVPLSIAAHERLNLDSDDVFDLSARHRIIIWGNIAERVFEAPLLGHGTRSIYKLNADDKQNGRGADVIGLEAIPPHAHNIYLQTWYELGAVGACLAALGIWVLMTTGFDGLPRGIFPFMLSAAATGMVQIFSSFEIWQIWFLSLLVVSVVVTAMARELETAACAKDNDELVDPSAVS